MSLTIKPTVGRIVHFVCDKRVYPATVTHVWSEGNMMVNLNVCNDGSFPIIGTTNPVLANVMMTSVDYSESHKDHTWHWPERA